MDAFADVSATTVNEVSSYDDGRPLIILYIGDHDPSGVWISDQDIPERLKRYGDDHISISRIALLRNDCVVLGARPAFSVEDKKKDPRAPWFRKTYGQMCCELEAMDPKVLRARRRRDQGTSSLKHGSVVGSSTQQSESLRDVLDKSINRTHEIRQAASSASALAPRGLRSFPAHLLSPTVGAKLYFFQCPIRPPFIR